MIDNPKEKCGNEYCSFVDRVMSIRANRRELYGDSFENESIDDLLVTIFGKLNRFKVLLKNDSPMSQIKQDDELLDTINYILFVLINLDKKRRYNE